MSFLMNRGTNHNIAVILFTAAFLVVSASGIYAGPCDDCHKSPPRDPGHTLHSGAKDLKPAYGEPSTTSKTTGPAQAYGFNCGNCHPLNNAAHRNTTVDVSLEKSNSGLNALNAPDAGFDPVKKTCSGTYCHSSGGSIDIQYKESPSWVMKTRVDERCQGCHGAPPSYPGTPERPNAHFNHERGSGHLLGIHWDSVGGHTKESVRHGTASQMGCSTCHYDTVREDLDTTFIDPVNDLFTCRKCHEKRNGDIFDHSLHVNGKIDVLFPDTRFRSKAQLLRVPAGWRRINSTGRPDSCDETVDVLSVIRFKQKERSCANVACHLNQKDLAWGSRVDCPSCHAGIKKALH